MVWYVVVFLLSVNGQVCEEEGMWYKCIGCLLKMNLEKLFILGFFILNCVWSVFVVFCFVVMMVLYFGSCLRSWFILVGCIIFRNLFEVLFCRCWMVEVVLNKVIFLLLRKLIMCLWQKVFWVLLRKQFLLLKNSNFMIFYILLFRFGQ